MARPRVGAWYRAERDAWYAYFGGKAVPLGVKGESNRLAAQEAFFRLNANGGKRAEAGSTPQLGGCVVGELVQQFLTDAEMRLSIHTVRIYRYDLERFAGEFSGERADGVRSEAITAWVRSLAVADSTKRIALASVSAFFGWCVRNGFAERNPVKRVSRPRVRSRAESAVISPDEHRKLLKAASPWMRNVLVVLHATGCRPGEACRIAVENFDPIRGVVKLVEHKTAGKTDRPRLIFVPPAVCELLGELAAKVESGPILRTKHGQPWCPRRITEQMRKVRKRAGVRKIAYGYRHTFVTDALSGGTPEAVTAALVGHTSTAVLHKFYSHLGSNAEVLAKAVNTVRG